MTYSMGKNIMQSHVLTFSELVYNDRDPSKNLTKVFEDDLEVFNQVRSISGHLLVFSTHTNITSLKFFRNLERISGTGKFGTYYSLYLQFNKGLTDLGFPSLHTILDGSIYVAKNTKLCVAMTKDGLLEAEVLQPGTFLVDFDNAPCGTVDYCNC